MVPVTVVVVPALSVVGTENPQPSAAIEWLKLPEPTVRGVVYVCGFGHPRQTNASGPRTANRRLPKVFDVIAITSFLFDRGTSLAALAWVPRTPARCAWRSHAALARGCDFVIGAMRP